MAQSHATGSLIAGLMMAAASCSFADDVHAENTPADHVAASSESDAPAFFGPVFQPDRIIDTPKGLEHFSPTANDMVEVDGETAYFFGTVTKVNVWAVIVWFWPEIAMLVLLILITCSAWRLRRAIKRPQVKGEPYCRRCNYRLTGAHSKACPECGTTLTDKTRVLGKHRRARTPLLFIILWLGAAAFLIYRWHPPFGQSGFYGMGSNLPREGSASHWLNWPSHGMYEWGMDHNLWPAWSEEHQYEIAQVWRVDLKRGQLVDRMLEYQLADHQRFNGVSQTPESHRIGDLLFINTGLERHLYNEQQGIYATIGPGQWYNHDFTFWSTDLIPSRDGRYLFDAQSYEQIVAWDRTTWGEPIVCPVDLNTSAEIKPDFIQIMPLANRTAALVIVRFDNFIEPKVFVWNPTTNKVVHLPAALAESDTDIVVASAENRFIVTEETYDVHPHPVVWDTQSKDLRLAIPEQRLRTLDGVQAPFRFEGIDRTNQIIYIEGQGLIAWHLLTGEVNRLQTRPADDAVDWIKTLKANRPVHLFADFRKGEVVLRDTRTGDVVASIPVPVSNMEIYNDTYAAKNSNEPRMIIGSIGQTYVVYDRQTRKWIGRFNAAVPGMRSTMNAFITGDHSMLVVALEESGTRQRLLVFDLNVEPGKEK